MVQKVQVQERCKRVDIFHTEVQGGASAGLCLGFCIHFLECPQVGIWKGILCCTAYVELSLAIAEWIFLQKQF